MAILMGGRAAEYVVFSEFSTGAADDLAKDTDVARQYVTRFGMSEGLVQAVLEQVLQPYLEAPAAPTRRDYSDETSRELDLAVRALIQAAFERARAILVDRRFDLDAGATLLLDREVITPLEFPALGRVPAASSEAA